MTTYDNSQNLLKCKLYNVKTEPQSRGYRDRKISSA